MKKHRFFKGISGLCIGAVLLATALTTPWTPVQLVPVSAKTLEQLQTQRTQNETLIKQKQAQLEQLKADMDAKSEYQKTLAEKIALQQENLDIVNEELKRINQNIDATNEAIVRTQDDMKILEADIAVGKERFKQRLRVMYVQGGDTLASAIVGATDFYDFLSKYELIARIAKHDTELINDLKADLVAYDEKEKELQEEQQALQDQQEHQQQKKQEFSQDLATLQVDYANSSDSQIMMAEEQKHLNAEVGELEKNNKLLEAEEEKIRADLKRAAEEAKKAASTTTTAAKSNKTTTTAKKNSGSNQPSSNQGAVTPKTTTVTAAKPQPAQTTTTVKQTQAPQTQAPATQPAPAPTTTAKPTTTAPPQTQPPQTEPPQTEPPKTEPPQTEPPATEPPAPQTEPANASGFAWPVPGHYYITSGFGARWGTTHKGIDISDGGISGEPVTAAMSGTVIRVETGCPHNYGKDYSCGCGGGYGNYVIIQHDGSYSTLYGHMASVAVSQGQTVNQGDTVGYVGSTGWSTGYHLHFEIRIDGSQVDPQGYL